MYPDTSSNILLWSSRSMPQYGFVPNQHQIGQAKEREQLYGIFRQPTVNSFPEEEQVLDQEKGMFDFGPHTNFENCEFFRMGASLVVGSAVPRVRFIATCDCIEGP